jgi:hypothetical protein
MVNCSGFRNSRFEKFSRHGGKKALTNGGFGNIIEV